MTDAEATVRSSIVDAITSTETADLRQPCGHDLQDLVTVCNMCRTLSEEDRVAELKAENRYLRELVALASRCLVERYSCAWCGVFRSHSPYCPAFTPDGKVRTKAP